MKTFKRDGTIYLDHHATTPMDPRVLKAMLPYFVHRFGNTASFTHSFGREAQETVDLARSQIARLIQAQAQDIVFTSGATESNNLALKGVAQAYRSKGDHFISSRIEHKSVLDPLKRLSQNGFRVTLVPVGRDGIVDPSDVKKAITPKTILISIMAANNETGAIQPIADIARIAKKRGVLFHSDGAQAVGKIPIDVRKMGIDLLSFTAHKIYGPKGVGALYVRKKEPRVNLVPMLDGGGHETGLRSGTLNVPGIVGFAKACEICRKTMKVENRKIAALRDQFKEKLFQAIPGGVIHGQWRKRLPNNLNLSFLDVDAGDLMRALPALAFSSGSACTSTSLEPSYVLKAMGVPKAQRRSSLRFGFGRFNTQRDVERAGTLLIRAVKNLRGVV